MPPKGKPRSANGSLNGGTEKIENYRQSLLQPLATPKVQTDYVPGTNQGILPIVVRKDPANMLNRVHMPVVYIPEPKDGYWSRAVPLTNADYAKAAKDKVEAIGEKVQATLGEIRGEIELRDESSTTHRDLVKQVQLAEKHQTNAKKHLDKAKKELTELISVPILTDEDRTSPIEISACCLKLFAFWSSFLLAYKDVEMAQADVTGLDKKIELLLQDIVTTKKQYTTRYQRVEVLVQELHKQQDIQEQAENTFRYVRELQNNQRTEEELATARSAKRPRTSNKLVVLEHNDPMIQALEKSMETAPGGAGPSDGS